MTNKADNQKKFTGRGPQKGPRSSKPEVEISTVQMENFDSEIVPMSIENALSSESPMRAVEIQPEIKKQEVPIKPSYGDLAENALKNFSLPRKKIGILLNKLPTAFIPDTEHLASGLAPNGKYSLVCPMDRDGRLVNPLTPQEQAFMEDSSRSGMYWKPGDLNINVPRDRNYWMSYRLNIPKEGLQLDLSMPEDYIAFKVALANRVYVAPSYQERINKATYKFYISDSDKEAVAEAALADMEATAYIKIGELRGNRPLSLSVLRLLGKSISTDARDESIVAEMRKVIKEPKGLEKFLAVVGDPNLQLKSDILKGYSAGFLIFKNTRYVVKDSGLFLGTLDEAVTYLKDPQNQDTYLALRAAIV